MVLKCDYLVSLGNDLNYFLFFFKYYLSVILNDILVVTFFFTILKVVVKRTFMDLIVLNKNSLTLFLMLNKIICNMCRLNLFFVHVLGGTELACLYV